LARKDISASIKVEGLHFAFGKRCVLRDISFVVGPGEFEGILGPNGSGKTTLLNCVNGSLKFSTGKVHVGGKDVKTIGSLEMARLVAMVPQESALDFDFTVEEIVLMGRYSHIDRFRFEDQKDYDVAAEAMKETGTWKLRDRLVTNLSGGERQRVVIARALAQEPKVLLLDEPTTHLDIRHQLEVLGLIRKLNEARGLTVLAVFHDLNLTGRFCDRVLLMDEGSIMATGTPAEVLTVQNIEKAYGVEARIGQTAHGKVAVEVGELTQRDRG
jgi:iron complex transport system ATP-binding protein